jgi:hypothetical protein
LLGQAAANTLEQQAAAELQERVALPQARFAGS